MADPTRYLVLAGPDEDLQGGHGDDASWTIEIAPSPEAAVERWVGKRAPGFGDDRKFVVYEIDGAERFIVESVSNWEVAHQ